VRYIHMSPKRLDADGILSGKRLEEGETLGQVGNYNDYERGTTYHLHFDMQVPTAFGYVFVNPYMTLVSAYERLIGARGRELVEVAERARPSRPASGAETTTEGSAKPLPPHRTAVRRPPLPEPRPRHRRRHVADR
jgi:hypothetical protein